MCSNSNNISTITSDLHDNIIAELTLKNLITRLQPVTAAWHPLGLQLEVPYHILHEIELNYQKVDRRMIEVLNFWWRNCPTRSWRTIADALRAIGYGNLAKELENESSGKCK